MSLLVRAHTGSQLRTTGCPWHTTAVSYWEDQAHRFGHAGSSPRLDEVEPFFFVNGAHDAGLVRHPDDNDVVLAILEIERL